MNELTKELKETLIKEIKNSFIYGIIPPQKVKKNYSEHDWIELLKSAKWKETNYEGIHKHANIAKVRFIKNLDLFSHTIAGKQATPLLGIYGIIFSDRNNIITKIFENKTYDEMSKDPYDFDYVINEENLEKALSNLTMRPKCLSVNKCFINFSASTFTGDKIPDCPECKGRGKCHCTICKGEGEIICEDCKGKGWLICEKCEGIGEIQYEAGNYSNGELRIKTKTCPICEGKGKLKCDNCNGKGKIACEKCNGKGEVTCRRCHGSGKTVNSPVMQTIKSFEDRYFFLKNMSFVSKSNDENEVRKLFYFTNDENELKTSFYFIPNKYLQMSQLYQSANKILIDNKTQIANEVFSLGGEYHSMYKAIQKDIKELWGKQKAVCLLENYFTTSPITIISAQYADSDGCNHQIEFYAWDNLLWCDDFINELSFWKLLLLKIKKTIS